MALSIGVSVGSSIFVGGVEVKVLDILRSKPSGILLRAGPQEFLVSHLQRTEILPDVFVSDGTPEENRNQARGNRLAFEAPKHVRIIRKSLGSVS